MIRTNDAIFHMFKVYFNSFHLAYCFFPNIFHFLMYILYTELDLQLKLREYVIVLMKASSTCIFIVNIFFTNFGHITK